jgi:preprotein translocase subunit SecE
VSQTSTGDASRPGRDVPRSGRGTTGGDRTKRGNVFARFSLFLRQVVAELRKVVRPTRQELITYTTVCMVFVAVMMAIVSSLDLGFGRLVLFVFGGGSS